MSTNATYTQQYFDIINSLDGDKKGRRNAYITLQNSTAIVHHKVVAFSYVPRLFNMKTYQTMKYTAETAHSILCKVIKRYLDDPTYRDVYDFDSRLKELILLPRGYDALLPFARVDTFLDEDSYSMKFCEFNGDGSSGMNENREITNALVNSPAFVEFSQNHKTQTCDLFEPWIDIFLDIYDSYQHKVEKPRIAICDYLENGVVDEFYIYVDLFKTRGVECCVCDVRDLTFDGTSLCDGDGKQVDAIWRRCVTNDVIDHWDASQDLIEAVRAEKVALIGSFAGHIVHDKQIFKALFDERTTSFLTDEEIDFIHQTVPLTAFLDENSLDISQVRTNKDAWIIKPTDHYGAEDVYAGCACTPEEWNELIDRFENSNAGHPFIAQHYINAFKTETLPPDHDCDTLNDDEMTYQPQMYNNLNGLYLYNGTFQGVFSRLGPLPTISKPKKGLTTATIWVSED